MVYEKDFKLNTIRKYQVRDISISKFADEMQIPKQTLARWIKQYKKLGEKGLENKKQGAKKVFIDPIIEKKIIQLWKEKNRSRYRMRKDLKTKNINISGWTVDKIYKKNNLNLKKFSFF
ncbi:MAG: helix-turn-helix domain containing protein [Candidatus Pacearchaeota archaeon]